jgi:hypothetical protein
MAPEEKDKRTFDIDSIEACDIHNTHQQSFDLLRVCGFCDAFAVVCVLRISVRLTITLM